MWVWLEYLVVVVVVMVVATMNQGEEGGSRWSERRSNVFG